MGLVSNKQWDTRASKKGSSSASSPKGSYVVDPRTGRIIPKRYEDPGKAKEERKRLEAKKAEAEKKAGLTFIAKEESGEVKQVSGYDVEGERFVITGPEATQAAEFISGKPGKGITTRIMDEQLKITYREPIQMAAPPTPQTQELPEIQETIRPRAAIISPAEAERIKASDKSTPLERLQLDIEEIGYNVGLEERQTSETAFGPMIVFGKSILLGFGEAAVGLASAFTSKGIKKDPVGRFGTFIEEAPNILPNIGIMTKTTAGSGRLVGQSLFSYTTGKIASKLTMPTKNIKTEFQKPSVLKRITGKTQTPSISIKGGGGTGYMDDLTVKYKIQPSTGKLNTYFKQFPKETQTKIFFEQKMQPGFQITKTDMRIKPIETGGSQPFLFSMRKTPALVKETQGIIKTGSIPKSQYKLTFKPKFGSDEFITKIDSVYSPSKTVKISAKPAFKLPQSEIPISIRTTTGETGAIQTVSLQKVAKVDKLTTQYTGGQTLNFYGQQYKIVPPGVYISEKGFIGKGPTTTRGIWQKPFLEQPLDKTAFSTGGLKALSKNVGKFKPLITSPTYKPSVSLVPAKTKTITSITKISTGKIGSVKGFGTSISGLTATNIISSNIYSDIGKVSTGPFRTPKREKDIWSSTGYRGTQKSITISLPKQKTTTQTALKTVSKSVQIPKIDNIFKTSSITKQQAIQTPKVTQITKQITKTALVLKTDFAYTFDSSMGRYPNFGNFIPKGPNRFVLDFPPTTTYQYKKKKTKRKGYKRKTKYTPSVGGIILGRQIGFTPKGLLTGIEIRPVVRKRRRRK